MNISKRLKTIASMIETCNMVADIGTDHGYIPIFAVTEGISNKAIAMDINEGPLQKAKENVELYNLSDRVELRLSDGLAGLNIGEADAIVIAGMGGILINRILEVNLDKALSAKQLILSPHSDVALVRTFLADHGFTIKDENIVYDEGKYYFVIKAHKGHMVITDPLHIKFGKALFSKKNPVFKDYLEYELHKESIILDKLKSSDNNTRAAEIRSDIDIIKRGLLEYESL